jgi:hypothetical protein
MLTNQVIQRGLLEAFIVVSRSAANSIGAGEPLRAVSAAIVAFCLLLAVLLSSSVGVLQFAIGFKAARRFGSRLARAGSLAILVALLAGVVLDRLIGRHLG